MKPLIKSTAIGIAAVLAMTATTSSIGAADQTVSVSVNGSPVTFDQPPIERSGRVFVPLRGVFEQLGASVTYDNGNIVAVGNGRTIDLNVGSTTAVVNGTQQQLDVAPFLIGARTLVPLRFVSQALGAYVEWDQSTNSVAITAGQGGSAPVNQVGLSNERPANNAVVPARRPAVSAQFSQAVDPNSIRVTLDDRDVSGTTYVSANGFLFTPPYDLSASVHTVRVSGKSAGDGTPFSDYWSFTSGTSAQSNYITNVSPPNGAALSSGTFTVSGTTFPNASVHITAVGSASVGGMFRVNTGSYSADVSADPSGQFSQTVSINTVAGGQVGVRITSTAPTTNAGATVTVLYNT